MKKKKVKYYGLNSELLLARPWKSYFSSEVGQCS